MKIAFFHPHFTAVGGAELNALKQAASLRELGCEVHFVTLGVEGAFWQTAFADWPVRIVPKRHWSDALRGWSRVAKLRSRASRVAPWLEPYDHVISINHPSCTMLGSMRLPGRRSWYCNEAPRGLFPQETAPYGVAALHRLGPIRPALALLAKEIEAREGGRRVHEQLRRQNLEAIPQLDYFMFNSQFVRGTTESIYGPLGGDVLYPTIDFSAPRALHGPVDRGALKILVQTRLTALKNVETLLEGFLLFAKSHPGAELHIAGTGPSRASLEATAHSGGPRVNITFHGFLSDPELELLRRRCDVYALLPLDESFGMVFPEAAAEGLLLVGPDHGGPFEIMQEGRLGWPCDAFSPRAVSAAFEAICACTDAELDERRQAADLSCRARFSAAVLGPRLLSLLQDRA